LLINLIRKMKTRQNKFADKNTNNKFLNRNKLNILHNTINKKRQTAFSDKSRSISKNKEISIRDNLIFDTNNHSSINKVSR